jgi:putative hydrolase of the HAD superfamily
MSRNLRFISFDVDGTLVDRRFADLVWETGIPMLYAKQKGIDLESAKRIVMKAYAMVSEEDPRWYNINYWFSRFKLTDSWKNLLAQYTYAIKLYPEVKRVIDSLSKEYKLIIISNAAKNFIEAQIEPIKHRFQGIFSTTDEFKMTKRPEAYAKVCAMLGIEPGELAHLGDDRRFDLINPRKIGVEAYLLCRHAYESEDLAVRDLDEFAHRLRCRSAHKSPG